MPPVRAKNVFESVFGDGKNTGTLHSSRMSRDSLPPLLRAISPSAAVGPTVLLKQLLNLLLPILMPHARQYFYWEGGRLLSSICLGVGRTTWTMVIQEVALRENSSGLPSSFPVHGIKVRKGSIE